MRRQHFTLIEVLIGLVLAAMLIGILLGAYRQVTIINKEISVARAKVMTPTYLHKRLSETLTRATMTPSSVGVNSFFFTTDPLRGIHNGPSLVFTYNNGIDPDPNYCGAVLARLYATQQGLLCLATWPMDSQVESQPFSSRVEILCDQVSSWSLEMYQPPDPEQKPISPPSIELGKDKTKPLPRWQTSWPLSHKELPAMVKVTVTRGLPKETPRIITLTYQIPEANKEVTFVQDRFTTKDEGQ